MRAGMDAIETEGTIEVAGLAWREQVQFAAGDAVAAAQTILAAARGAHPRIADLHLQWRHQRLHKVELADRTEIFAERRAAEPTVDDEGADEVAQREARRPPR